MSRFSWIAGVLALLVGLAGCASTRAAEAREQEARQGKRHDEAQQRFDEARKQNAPAKSDDRQGR